MSVSGTTDMTTDHTHVTFVYLSWHQACNVVCRTHPWSCAPISDLLTSTSRIVTPSSEWTLLLSRTLIRFVFRDLTSVSLHPRGVACWRCFRLGGWGAGKRQGPHFHVTYNESVCSLHICARVAPFPYEIAFYWFHPFNTCVVVTCRGIYKPSLFNGILAIKIFL